MSTPNDPPDSPSPSNIHTLPNFPFLTQLLRHANYHPDSLAVRDDNVLDSTGAPLEKTYADLLLDAVLVREALRKVLPPEAVERLQTETKSEGDVGSVFIGVLAPGGYEYVVAIVAVWALGAVVVPMTTALPVLEAVYFVRKSQQSVILTSSSATTLGASITSHLRSTSNTHVPSIEIRSSYTRRPSTLTLSEILVAPSSTPTIPDSAAGIIIFTSGTTGPPKGAVLPRRYIHESSRAIADHFGISHSDTLLHLLPVHHVTGLAINILPFLMAGACVEFRSGGFDTKWTWERWRRGNANPNTTSTVSSTTIDNRANGTAAPLTVFSAVPTIYMRLMRHFQSHISKLPPAEQTAYVTAARRFRLMMCGTSALPKPVADFWKEILGHGRQVLTRYGSTEAGAVLGTWVDGGEMPDGAVGRLFPGVEVKLLRAVDDDGGVKTSDPVDEEEGTETGEILVKSPHLFSRYLDDAATTASCFDSHGYFRTGDIARRSPSGWFSIVGRASQDIIKSGGYKISALDIEREILGLPYVGEVIVVGVPDEEFGQRVAAVVTVREDWDGAELTLDRLRADLRLRLVGYKLPTLMRILEGELPKTASGKVLKKKLGLEVFPSPGWERDQRVMAWRAERSKL